MTFAPHQYNARQDLLRDKIIMVTGAGDGIGKAAAQCFAAHGATVILSGRTTKKLEMVYDEIEAAGYPTPAIVPVNLETLDPTEADKIFAAIESEFGRLDGLLHSAGLLGQITPLAGYDPATWLQVMQVNVNAAFLLTQSLMPLLENSDAASVIFTTSSVGRKGRAYWGAYAVSKFATEGLMQTWADELEDISNVRTNCINPGGTRTRMRAQAYPAESPSNNPLPEEIMPLYLYLMGDDSRKVNGQSFDAQPKH